MPFALVSLVFPYKILFHLFPFCLFVYFDFSFLSLPLKGPVPRSNARPPGIQMDAGSILRTGKTIFRGVWSSYHFYGHCLHSADSIYRMYRRAQYSHLSTIFGSKFDEPNLEFYIHLPALYSALNSICRI